MLSGSVFIRLFARLLEHDLVASEHMCHGELQAHYSCDIKLNFILLSSVALFIIFRIFRYVVANSQELRHLITLIFLMT